MYTSLSDALVQRWRNAPSAVALVRVVGDKVETITNTALAAQIMAEARRLDEVGIGADDIVAIRSKDKTAFLIASLATTLLGAAFVPVPWPALHDSAQELVAMTGAKALVTDQPDERGAVPVIVLGNTAPGDLDLELAFAYARRATPSTLYMIQPTSGSTGAPKLVPRRHDAFLRLPWAIGADTHRDVASRIMIPLTLEHGGGLYGVAVWLCVGDSMAFPELDDVDMRLDNVRLLAPTMMMMTPRVVTSLFNQAQARSLEARAALGDQVRTLVTGGAKSMPEALAWLVRGGIQVVEIYGASEFSVIAHSPWDSGWSNDHVGALLPDVDIRFADDKELLVKTPAMMTGYLGKHAPPSFTEDGFYRTGDLGELVGDKLRILGRRRDVVNLFDGSNVYPSIVEGMIESLPWVKEVVVCGDQRPALAALIVVHDDLAAEQIRPETHPGHYELARRELSRFNDQLDASEQVRHVVLLGAAFPAEILSAAAIGKLKRDRKLAAQRYRTELEDCYRPGSAYRITNPSGREQRHHKRYPFGALVELSSPAGTEFLYAKDLGLDGARLECFRTLAGELQFRPIGHALSRRVSVRWTARGEVGLQFLEHLTIAERDRLLKRGER